MQNESTLNRVHRFPFVDYLKNPSPYINVPFTWDCILNLSRLDSILDDVCETFGKPVVILGAYRTKAVNQFMKGTDHNDYLTGRGVDITARDKFDNDRLYRVLCQKMDYCDVVLGFSPKNDDHFDRFHISISNTPRHRFIHVHE